MRPANSVLIPVLTNQNWEFIFVSFQNSYPNVIAEVEGTFHETVFTYHDRSTFLPKQSLLDQSFVPSKCREYGTNNEWYDFKLRLGYFREYNLVDHPPHLQTPQYDGVRNILEDRFADFTKTQEGWVLDEGNCCFFLVIDYLGNFDWKLHHWTLGHTKQWIVLRILARK